MHFLNRRSARLALATSLLLFGAVQLGCEPTSPSSKLAGRAPLKSPVVPQPVDEPREPEQNVLPPPIDVAAGVKPWITSDQLPWEAWYLQYMDNQRIGYSHVQVNKSTIKSESSLIRISRTDLVEVVNNGTSTVYKREMESKEYIDGRLISLQDISRSLGNKAVIEKTVTEGKLDKDVFNATTTIGEEVTTSSVAWESGAWGIMGLQAMLLQHPPQPGELLQGKVFIPQLYKIASAELLAGQPDITTLPGGKTESLIPVDVVLWTEETGMRSRNWINSRGEVLKTKSLSGPLLSTFWTTAEVAQPVRDEYELGELLHLRVPISGERADLVGATRVTYNLERSTGATGAEVYSLLSKTPQQMVVSLTALNAEVTVSQIELPQSDSEAAPPTDDLPADNFLASSSFVPAGDVSVKQLAQKLLEASPTWAASASVTNPVETNPVETNPVESALQITQGLHQALQPSPLDRQIVHPLQTMRQAQGDCVEQSLLLASLLRSQQIPTRLACGLAVDPQQRDQMRFDMWAEAWLIDRWVPLDPATGQLAAPDRLKFLDSSVGGNNPYEFILQVFRELPGLKVKLVSYE